MDAAAKSENWYVLFTMVVNQERACMVLRREGLNAFLPSMEYYRRDSKSIETKPMFPGYLFIREKLDQREIDQKLEQLAGRVNYVRQLKEDGIPSPLSSEEIGMFTNLLDEAGVLRMSKAYLNLKTGKAVVTEGPLRHYQDSIVKVDKHNRLAWLELRFMDKNLQAGIEIQMNAAGVGKNAKKPERIMGKNPDAKEDTEEEKRRPAEKRAEERANESTEGNESILLEIDLEELKSKMMRL